jgi:hypothetical protein
MREQLSFTLTPENVKYVRQYNDMLERKHGVKFGCSEIMDILIEVLRDGLTQEVERRLIRKRRAEEHLKALKDFQKRKARVDHKYAEAK